jgi:hypothetical protein
MEEIKLKVNLNTKHHVLLKKRKVNAGGQVATEVHAITFPLATKHDIQVLESRLDPELSANLVVFSSYSSY